MKKIINGKMYNTETAKKIAYSSNGLPLGDFNRLDETLYQKNTNEFFLYGSGGANTQYSESCGENSWSGGNGIIPLSIAQAKDWIENHCPADTYIKTFGDVEE